MIKDKNNIIFSSFQSEMKNIKKEKENLETAYQNQKKNVSNLKNIIMDYEKELNIKNNYINELKQKVEELNTKIKNIKEDIKKEHRKEIIKLNEQINNLKNEIEIKEQKVELNNVKYNNLQMKYLKMVHNIKRMEQDNLLILSMNQLRNKNKQIPNKKMTLNINNNSPDICNYDTNSNVILPILKDNKISNNIKIVDKEQLKKENQDK